MLTVPFLLLLILLAVVVHLSPVPGKWGKLLVWTILMLIAVILVATHVLRFS